MRVYTTIINICEIPLLYTSLSHSILRRAISKGTLKASRQTGKILFKKKDLDKYLTG
jgi:hypothetical protein